MVAGAEVVVDRTVGDTRAGTERPDRHGGLTLGDPDRTGVVEQRVDVDQLWSGHGDYLLIRSRAERVYGTLRVRIPTPPLRDSDRRLALAAVPDVGPGATVAAVGVR